MKRILLSIIIVVFTILATIGAINVRFNSDPRFLLDDMEQLDPTLEIWSEDFENVDRQCQVLIEADNCLTVNTLRVVQKIVGRVEELDFVESVVSPLNIRGRRRAGRYLLPLIPVSLDPVQLRLRQAEIESHPLIEGQLVSSDRKRLLILIALNQASQETPLLEQTLRTLRNILREESKETAVRASLTGAPAIQADIHREMRLDQLRFNIIGLSLASLVAVLVFRSLSAAIIAGTAPSIGVLWTVGVMGVAGIDLNIMNSVLPLMILVIGYTDSVHILLHVRRSLRKGESQAVAVDSAVRALWMPCLMTSLTTAAGFASLLISDIPVLREFGMIGAIGCTVNFLAVISILPLLAMTPLGRMLVKSKDEKNTEQKNESPRKNPDEGLLAIAIDHLGRFADRYHTIVSIAGIALVLLCTYACTKLTPDNRIRYNLPVASDSFRAFHEIDEHFGGVMMIHAMVRWDDSRSLADERLLTAMSRIDRAFEKHPTICKPLSILNVLESLPRLNERPGAFEDDPLTEQVESTDPLDKLRGKTGSLRLIPEEMLARLYNREQKRATIYGHVPDCGTGAIMSTLADLQVEMDRIMADYPGIRIDLTGHTAVGARLFAQLMSQLGRSLLLAGVIIFLFLLVAIRSIPLAMLGIIPNAIALSGTGAAIVLSGESFQYVSVLVFTICLGIAVDDTIHFIVRFQRLRKDSSQGDRCPIRATVHEVGLPILMSTVIFLVGFVTVSLSEIPTLRTFSWLACISLTLAVLGDLVLLPALIRTLTNIRKRLRGEKQSNGDEDSSSHRSE